MKKRVLPLLLTLSLLLSLASPLTAIAETYSGTCGTNVRWSLDTATGELTITGTGAMTSYEYADSVPWYSRHGAIKSVTISGGVTSIADYAFYDCAGLKSVTIMNDVTSIGDSAFYGCDGLTTVTIPGSVESIGQRAFYDCDGLTSVTIMNGVTSIGYGAFFHCDVLTTVTIPGSVKSIGQGAFYDCFGLKSITIPDGVTSIGDRTFDSCRALTTVTIPDSVTYIGNYAFDSCSSLGNVYYAGTAAQWETLQSSIGGYNTPLLNATLHTDGIVATGSCGENLTWKLDIDGVLTITGTGTMTDYDSCDDVPWYRHREKIASIEVAVGTTAIGSSAFQDCTGLTSVTIPNSVISFGENAFAGCDLLSEVRYEGTKEQWDQIAFGSGNGILEEKITYVYKTLTFSFAWDREHYNPGDTTTVTVSLSGSEGASFAGYELHLADVEGLTLTKITPIAQREFSGDMQANAATGVLAFSLYGSSDIDMANKSYDIATLTYTVGEDAAERSDLACACTCTVRHADNAAAENVLISAGTAAVHNITVTLQEDAAGKATITGQKVFYAKYNETGLYTDWQRTEAATAADFVCTFAAGHSLAAPAFKETDGENTVTDFSALLETTWTESNSYTLITGQKSTLTLDSSVLGIVSGAEEAESVFYVTENTDLVVRHVPQAGKLLVGVSASVGGVSVPMVHNSDGSYTLPGDKVTGNVVLTADVIDGTVSFTGLADYLDDSDAAVKLVKITVAERLADSHLTLGTAALRWSAKYSAYIGLVDAAATEESISAALSRADGIGDAVAYDGDVTTDAQVDISDALAINARLFNINWIGGFQEENLLEMDVNGDGVVNVQDIQRVLMIIVGLVA